MVDPMKKIFALFLLIAWSSAVSAQSFPGFGPNGYYYVGAGSSAPPTWQQYAPLASGGLGGSQAAATAGQVPVFPGSGGAAVPTTLSTGSGTVNSSTAGQVAAYNGTTAIVGQAHIIYANAVSGVDPTGATDSATAINGIISSSACSTKGCTIEVCGYYKINSSILITQGVVMHGCGQPPNAAYPGMTSSNTPAYFQYNGAANMFTINGPLSGWGLESIGIDGNTTATNCILNISGAWGHVRDVALRNCTYGYNSTTSNSGAPSAANTNSGNAVDHLSIQMPNTVNSVGIRLSGYADAFDYGDSCCQSFNNINIWGVSGQTQYCIQLGIADTNIFNQVICLMDANHGWGILWSYFGAINYLPANNAFYAITVSSLTSGTPSTTQTQEYSGSPAGLSTMHNWVDRPALINGDTWTTISGVSIVNSP